MILLYILLIPITVYVIGYGLTNGLYRLTKKVIKKIKNLFKD